MSELVTTRITAHATTLGLRHLAATAPALIQRAHDAQLGYADFLDLILGEETAAKDDRRFTSALHVSGLPHHKTIDDFDFTFQPDLDIRKIKDLATLGFAAQAANIALLGPPGTGKTHLACALAVAAGALGRQFRGYLRSSVLIIDEVGYLPLTRSDANLVFQIIARRYEKGSVIITSNKTFSEWGQVFTDEVLATAILDRFLHHCDVITINGPSWRMKNHSPATDATPPMP